jgi:uracil-DNA glycosylase
VIVVAANMIDPIIERSWKEALEDQFQSASFADLKQFLLQEKQQHVVYPPGKMIFNAFDHSPFHDTKVVIIGQDPYHGVGQAHGLCFSVADGVPPPKSLINIFQELHEDIGVPIPTGGNLEKWAKQGILLLNSILTVRANQAGSHQNRGWERFTDGAIKALSDQREGIIFILWGNFAQQKAALIDSTKHHIIQSAHPSPLAAHRGFFGSKPFSQTNQLLIEMGKEPIDWDLS